MSGPLDGVRIIDLTSVILGPYATQILADYGADVIKVEPPEGDNTRYVAAHRNPGMGANFLHLNRNKRSIVLNLKKPEGHAALLRLAKTADVLAYNVRPAAMARLKLSYDDVCKVNPRIIYAGSTGFRQSGPYAAKAAYDDIIQGLTGMPSLLSEAAGKPVFVPINMADRVCGVHLVNATLAALLHRERTGQGQEVEVPMFETMAEMVLSEHLWDNYFVPPTQTKNRNRMFDRRPYKTRDGYICVMAGGDKMFTTFCDVTGRPELKSDPRFAERTRRSANQKELYDEMEAALAPRTSAEWLTLLTQADIPAAPVHTMESLLADPHLNDVDFFQVEEHPTEGKLRAMRTAMRFSASPAMNRRPTPHIGEHTVEVLREAGLSSAEIDKLLADGMVRAGSTLQ